MSEPLPPDVETAVDDMFWLERGIAPHLMDDMSHKRADSLKAVLLLAEQVRKEKQDAAEEEARQQSKGRR